MTSVLLGMSGGVDSSTSAAYLLRSGYDVVGATCRFRDGEAADAAEKDAQLVCDRLGIRHVTIDARECFGCEVIDPFIASYASGDTPSPCVDCNARAKIPALLDAADQLGCKKVATGHYVRIVQLQNGRFAVKTGLDAGKDQSYMLALLSQEQLSRLVCPLGGTTKLAVRTDAAEMQFECADSPESQDICFIDDDDYIGFLSAHGCVDSPGAIVSETGEVLGEHRGLHRYTVGQRHGIGVAAPYPLYVLRKCAQNNTLIVGPKEQAVVSAVTVEDMNWQATDAPEEVLHCSVKLRYRSRAVPCCVTIEEGTTTIALSEPQPTTAPGQYAVLYMGDTVLGGGRISTLAR